MPDITADRANELKEKLGVKDQDVKRAFAENFAEALPYLNTPSLGTEENRMQAHVLYFGFKVGYLKGLEAERLTVRHYPR